MFKPKAIYYEKEIENYELGRIILKQYEDVPKTIIENHKFKMRKNNKGINVKDYISTKNKIFGSVCSNICNNC